MLRENLIDLLALRAVAQDRSFTKAAAKLGFSQSTLSHTIRELEARLGSAANPHHTQRRSHRGGRASAAVDWAGSGSHRGRAGGVERLPRPSSRHNPHHLQ